MVAPSIARRAAGARPSQPSSPMPIMVSHGCLLLDVMSPGAIRSGFLALVRARCVDHLPCIGKRQLACGGRADQYQGLHVDLGWIKACEVSKCNAFVTASDRASQQDGCVRCTVFGEDIAGFFKLPGAFGRD